MRMRGYMQKPNNSSYYFAPQALLAPLSGLPIVLNALLAPRVCCAGPV